MTELLGITISPSLLNRMFPENSLVFTGKPEETMAIIARLAVEVGLELDKPAAEVTVVDYQNWLAAHQL